MAVAHTGLHVIHAMGHQLTCDQQVPHGRANAVLLPHVIRYNASTPSKFVSFPKYNKFVADEKYAEIAAALNLPASTKEEGVESLVNAIIDLMKEVNEPLSFADCGIDEKTYMDKLSEVADKAFEDQCTTANPKLPLVKEIEQIMIDAYKGV